MGAPSGRLDKRDAGHGQALSLRTVMGVRNTEASSRGGEASDSAEMRRRAMERWQRWTERPPEARKLIRHLCQGMGTWNTKMAEGHSLRDVLG